MRHHYVPQFLLRPWTENTLDNRLEVFRLDLQGVPSLRRATRGTGREVDLYALTEERVAGMEQQAIERKFLRGVDNNGACVRSKLESHGLNLLTEDDRIDWALFLMSLPLRQPHIVEALKQQSSEMLRNILRDERPEGYEELAAGGHFPSFDSWVDSHYPGLIENCGLSFFPNIVGNEYYWDRFLRMRWWLWDFREVPYDLLLSDNPLIFTAGIEDANCIVALPISPKKAFMATQDEKVASIMREQFPRVLSTRLNEFSLLRARVRIWARRELPARRFIENRIHRRVLPDKV